MTFSFSSQPDYYKALLQGYSWTGNAGQATTNPIKYTFQLPTTSLDVGNVVTNDATIDGGLHDQVGNLLQLWSNVANITFEEDDVSPQLWIAKGKGI